MRDLNTDGIRKESWAVFRFIAGVLLVVLCFFMFWTASSAAATVGHIEIKGLSSVTQREFLDIFGVREGDPVDPAKISLGIKRAFLKGLFDDILVFAGEDENAEMIITVREREFIRKIYIRGDLPFPERVIREYFPIKEEQPLRHDLFLQATDQLKDKIARYGFPGPTITTGIEKTDRPNRVNLFLIIEAGPPLIIKDLRLTMISPLSPAATPAGGLAAVMRLSVGSVYNEIKLEEDMRRITEFLKKEGYYRPVVGPYSYKDEGLEIAINPGRRLAVKIDGNSALSAGRLQKEAPFFEVGEFHDELVEETIAKMLALYHSEGYPFAQIAPVINADENLIEITFFIFEGERVTVSAIEFGGVILPGKRLKEVLSIKEGEYFNPDLTEKDRDSLKEFYGALGFLEASVKGIRTDIDRVAGTVRLAVDVDEGKKTEIASVDISGTAPDTKEELMRLVGLKAGDPYNEVDISDARFRMIEYFNNHGYTTADISVQRNMDKDKVAVTFVVTEGKKKFFGRTIIKGNRKTKYEVIRRELQHSEGHPYNNGVLAEERQKLYRLGLFTDVEIGTIDNEQGKKDIIIRLNEGNAGSVEYGFGYAEHERFRGFAEVSYRNLWGMNREMLLRAEMSRLEKRYILQYNEPWFLERPLPLRLFFLHEKRDEINTPDRRLLYSLSRYSMLAGVEKRLSGTMKADLYYEFSLVRTSDVQPDVVLTKEDTGTLAISSIKPSLIYDTRDNPFDPQKGILAGATMKLASFVLFSETNFAKIELFGSSYHKLGRRVTLAVSLRGGVAYHFGQTSELPLVERFFLGGRSTVRGYEQDTLGPTGSDGNPTGGNAFLMGNIELRTFLGRGIGLVPFIDMGNVWRTVGGMNPGDLKYTAGMGLRYSTPVGPLRVDYGFKLNREPRESRGEIHFSVGHAF
ncbi:MAG: outer membrane protein assembly factor BamA [Nitrospirae bacterium]|nr:outer membrane protein assembly factor BamA [Nitrospirota bacterium]